MSELAIELVQPTMACVCMYCKREYKRIPCAPEQVDLVSHGVCPECTPRLWREAGIMRKDGV